MNHKNTFSVPAEGFEKALWLKIGWFVLFNDTWSQKGHSVSCMTILLISKCKLADRTSGHT